LDALSHICLLGDIVEKSESLGIDLGVSVVQPDLVEHFERESGIACLVLQQVAQVRLAGRRLVVLLEGLHGGAFLEGL